MIVHPDYTYIRNLPFSLVRLVLFLMRSLTDALCNRILRNCLPVTIDIRAHELPDLQGSFFLLECLIISNK